MRQLAFVEGEQMAVVKRTIVLPFLPPSKNVFEPWQPMWKKGWRNKWERHLLAAFDELQFPQGAARVVVHARLVFGSKRRRDWQNYVHPLWWVVADSLVKAGVIRDDTPNHFSVGPDGGIEFDVDKNRLSRVRQRTVLGFALEVADGGDDAGPDAGEGEGTEAGADW